jgi:hypothetical protein
MIAKRIKFRPMQMLAARNPHPVIALLNFRAHLAQIGGNGGNSV